MKCRPHPSLRLPGVLFSRPLAIPKPLAGLPPPTLYVVDGYAQFFRAYHAIRTPMTSPVTKEPTNMTFGFLGMLLKLLRGEGKVGEHRGGTPAERAVFPRAGAADPPAPLEPGWTGLCVCLDVSGDRGTFRSTIYPDYKAHRPPPPDDLEVQVDRCLKALERLGVPIIGAEGFEADDCIAAIVAQTRERALPLRIRIISKDKDLKQLLCGGGDGSGEGGIKGSSDGFSPSRGPTIPRSHPIVELYDIHTDELISEQTLRADIGIDPCQVIDMLALMGDNVDNVPGIEGVGPKTAAKLIAEHGSVDGVLAAAAAGNIKGKLGERIAAAAASPDKGGIMLSRELVTLRDDTPVTLDLEATDVTRIRLAELIPVLKELGFQRYQDEVRALLGQPGAGVGGAASGGPATVRPAQSPVDRDIRTSVGGDGAPLIPSGSEVRKPPARQPRVATDAPTGFMTLFDQPARAPGAAAGPTGTGSPLCPYTGKAGGSYRCITTREQLEAVVAEMLALVDRAKQSGTVSIAHASAVSPAIAIDTETTGLSPLRVKLCGVCISTAVGEGVYIPMRSCDASQHMDEPTVLASLGPLFEDPAVPKCGHNLKFDGLVLRKAGVTLAGFNVEPGPGNGDEAGREGARRPPLLPASTVFDSMVASFLIDASRSSHGLDALALALLGRTNISITELIGSGTREAGAGAEERTFDQVPLDAATRYAAEDADVALQLREVMLPQLRALGLVELFERLEMPLVEVLAELEWNGIRVDRHELDRQRVRLQGRIDELKKEISRVSMDTIGRTFNPDSPKQLGAILFNKPDEADELGGPGLGLKPVKRIKTGYSTDAEVLKRLAEDANTDPNASKIPGLVLEHRELTKLVSTYLVSLVEEINPDTGRVHSSFSQTVAVTGRLASSDPNLQNIPIRTDIGREIRRAFIADDGNVLISADYSQIELRLLAHLSQDPAMLAAINAGEDIHQSVAAQVFNVPLREVSKKQRNVAKMVNFGIVYGVTAIGLARRLGTDFPVSEAAEIISKYKNRFSGVTTFLEECIAQAKRHGYVETMLGRRRAIPDAHSTNPSRRAFAERTAINSVVQGSAADLIKLAMVDIHRALSKSRDHETKGSGDPVPRSHDPSVPRSLSSVRMLLQIHDELVFESPAATAEEARAFIVERMENAAGTWTMADGTPLTLSVPIKVDSSIAASWFDGK